MQEKCKRTQNASEIILESVEVTKYCVQDIFFARLSDPNLSRCFILAARKLYVFFHAFSRISKLHGTLIRYFPPVSFAFGYRFLLFRFCLYILCFRFLFFVFSIRK